jgi:hypothetical protein
MSKLHLWLTQSDTELDKNTGSLISLDGQKKYHFITEEVRFNDFLNTLQAPDTDLSLDNFLSNRWQQEAELEMVEKDYAGSSTYLHHRYTQDKVLHVILDLSEQTELENFAILNSLDHQEFEKIVLHVFTTQAQAISCWGELETKLARKDNNILAKVVLGSVSDIEIVRDTKHQHFSLLPRLMYEPTLASENEQYLSIDEYLKIHYGTHYYLTLEYYKPSFWHALQNTEEVGKLIQLVIQNQTSNVIFQPTSPNTESS